MKTALNELIEIIKQKRKESEISNTLLRFVHDEVIRLLEIEKQQIINSYNYMRCIGNFENGEQYFNETYKK